MRMALTVPVAISWTDSVGRAINSVAKANNLNLHGAAIRIAQDLAVGTEVIVRHGKGATLPARVVSFVRSFSTDFVYGIEFLPSNVPAIGFWGIHFPEAPQPVQAMSANRQRLVN